MHGARCYICGKGRVIGRQVSHSGVRTQRIFKPNLHWKRILIDGQKARIKMCTKCLKRMKKNASEKVPKVSNVPKVPKADETVDQNVVAG
ncbi:50S ribosomal protein L28 [Candidatus Microgenomates bacterium]|nr:50S ribosomal protein L28 [Candidatus Microgenomates bacterium]